MHTKYYESGISMLELLVALSFTGLMFGIALPQVAELKSSFNNLNAKSYFVQDVKRAQAEAITQGCRGIIKIAADGESYSFGCDFLSYDETADPTHDVTSFVRNLPTGVRIAASAPIIFNSRGQAVDPFYIISNSTVTFSEWNGGGYSPFSSGTLLGTGAFSFN